LTPRVRVGHPCSAPAMHFDQTKLYGAYLIKPVPAYDHRGFFARTFCVREFADQGLTTNFLQHSTSQSKSKGTLRGMHFQRPPHSEVKVVACLKGAVWDVIIDLRPSSPTYRRWQGFELTSGNRYQPYVPQGLAHGFQTLCDHTRGRLSHLRIPRPPGSGRIAL
jgi:dTDP-4-dehydrorhamnose 3,5-epimerase